MRHGRCEKTPWDDMWFTRDLRKGWRREHAHRVWSAMQAVLAVAALEQAHQSVWPLKCQDTAHSSNNAFGIGEVVFFKLR